MKLLKLVGSSLSSLSALLLFSTAATLPAQGQSLFGCPSGYVCIYPEGADLNSTPTNQYYYYGTQKLFNQYNFHFVVNNQTDGAPVALCKNSNGTDCPLTISAGDWVYYDLTPINSIVLIKP
jgi:hypothetical protein